MALSLSYYNDENGASATSPMGGAEPPVHKIEQAKELHLGKWLTMTALLSVAAWYTMVNPKWVPPCVAQTVKLSHTVSAEIKKCASTSLNATKHTPEMPKAATAKTSRASRKAGFMVPPPPPTPCVLPPGFAFSPIQQAAPKPAIHAAPSAPPANRASATTYSGGTTGGAAAPLYTEDLLTLSGAIASGNTVSVTVYNASLSGGQQTASVTATSSSIATTLSALTTAINNNTALSAAGVTAIAGTSSSNITLLNTGNNVTSYAASATGSATVTVSDL